MIPVSLSASSANCYELCPARWRSEWLTKTPSFGGSAANLGTALHKVVQDWIEAGYHEKPPLDVLETCKRLWDGAYWTCFADLSRYNEGWELLRKWLDRQDWRGRTVLSTETKKNFTLHTSAGDIPFNYIMDRVDRLDNGDIEIIDYKSVLAPVNSDQLKERIQPRCYALAAHLEFPDAKRIWVTFDLFRHDTIGTVFTKAECEATLKYLHALAERIIADDDPVEVLNPECRWCLRKSVCKTLNDHAAHAGETYTGSFEQIVTRRAELGFVRSAIENEIQELDRLIETQLDSYGVESEEVGQYRVGLSSARRRHVDARELAKHLPYDRFAEMATIGVTQLDDLLKAGELDPHEASLIRQTVSWRHFKRSVSVKPRNPDLSV